MNRSIGLCIVSWLAATACSRSLPSPSPVRMPSALVSARQLVVVSTPDWNATTGTLRRYERDAGTATWRTVGSTVPIVVGRTGLAWADETLASAVDQPVKHEGDGRSPAGVFPLDTAFGFAPRTEVPWVQLPYAQLRPGSECVDDVASVHYNTLVDRSAVRVDWNSAEKMREIPVYRIGVIVGYNAAPPQHGRGSCIFLHIWSGPSSVTAGCTALDAGELELLVRWLDATRQPAMVQLPEAQMNRFRSEWMLPPA